MKDIWVPSISFYITLSFIFSFNAISISKSNQNMYLYLARSETVSKLQYFVCRMHNSSDFSVSFSFFFDLNFMS